MKQKYSVMAAGIFFGFVLSRVGASDYDLIYKMFRAENLKLAWVILTAIVTGFIGMRVILSAGGKDLSGKLILVNKKRLSWLNAIGGAFFGIGWAMAGACPGTILAQVGEGKVLALFTLAGIIVGTYVYALLVERLPFLNI